MILCNEDFEKEQTVIIVVPYNYCEFTTIFGFVMVGVQHWFALSSVCTIWTGVACWTIKNSVIIVVLVSCIKCINVQLGYQGKQSTNGIEYSCVQA